MSLTSITEAINEAADNLHDVKPEERVALIAACDRLKATMETPLDSTVRIIMGVHNFAATRLGVEMGIFDAMIEKADGMSVQQLASSTGTDPELTVRVMKILTGMKLFKYVGDNSYIATPLAASFISASPLSDAVIHFGAVAETLVKLPDYFAANGYQNPGDAYSGPFQYSFGTDLHYFEWLKNFPKQQTAFNSLMTISRLNRGEDWFEFFPVETKFGACKDASAPLLVDIGGGLGHDLVAFKARYPNLHGKLILQDLPIVIDEARQISRGIDLVKYNFFDTQPVKGARAYYLRTVLHDWPEKEARKILGNIHEAMDENSLLLINENVLPEPDPPLYHAQMDFTMMAILSSLDRTEKQFRELLESSGFHLVKIWTSNKAVEASGILFEAVKK